MNHRYAVAFMVAACSLLWGASARALSSDGVAAAVPQFEKIATLVGPAALTRQVHLVVFLAYPNQAAVDSFTAAANNPGSGTYGAFLTPSQFDAQFGPSQHTYSTVEYVLTGAGMKVVQSYANRKVIDIVATIAQAQAFFGTIIDEYSYQNVTYYANSVPALVPNALKGVVMAVSGFNNFARKVATPLASLPGPSGFGPLDIETAYNEPIHVNRVVNGTGATLAIETVYDYNDSDLTGYWSAFGVQRGGSVARVIVGDPVNQGLPAPGQNDESTLDVEQSTSNAPGADALIYEGVDPLNSTFDDVYEQTVLDPRIDVVSTSWGSCEAGADPNEVAADNDLFEQGAAEGQTRFAASGDNGSKDCGTNNPPDGLPGEPNPTNVDFPASSPWIAGAGGTTLTVKPDRAIKSEVGWSDSGGGVSSFFSVPAYQMAVPTLANPNYRNVPDVALDADPNTPYALFYYGTWALPVGGTSAVAPNLAALYAQIDGYYGRRLGLAQTGLYWGFVEHTYPGRSWHDIISGSNGDFSAHAGYDNVTGVGSLNGNAFMMQIPRPRHKTPL